MYFYTYHSVSSAGFSLLNEPCSRQARQKAHTRTEANVWAITMSHPEFGFIS